MLLAHQGGWDELLFVMAPLALFVPLLLIANRRAARQLEAEAAGDDPDERAEPS